jgi:hypothetical protein
MGKPAGGLNLFGGAEAVAASIYGVDLPPSHCQFWLLLGYYSLESPLRRPRVVAL